VKELLKHKNIDVNLPNKYGQTPLYRASWKRNLDIVKELLKHKDIDVNRLDIYNQTTPLNLTSFWGYLDIVKELLKREDIDVNLQDKDGETPLFTASDEDHLNIVRMLLDAGADINIKNNEDKTALDIAIERNHDEIAELINEQKRRNEFRETLKSKTLEELRALVETQVGWYRNIILQFIRQRRVLNRGSRRFRERRNAPSGIGAQRAQESFADAAGQ